MMNLNGSLLRVGINIWYPYTQEIEGDSNTTQYEGLCIDLLQVLAATLNFTYNLVLPPDRKWGDQNGDQWTGLVGLLHRQEVDLVVAPLRPRINASHFFDLTTAFDFTYNGIAVKRVDHTNYLVTAFLWPFVWQVYAVLLGVFFSVLCLLVLVQRITSRFSREHQRQSFSAVDTALCLISSILNKDVTLNWHHWLPRFIISCWCFLGMVLSSCYNSKLTSLLVNVPAPPPFNSLAELVSRDDFIWGAVDSSMEMVDMSKSENPVELKAYQKILEFSKDDPEVLSVERDVHLNKVLKGGYAYIGEGNTIDLWALEHCEIAVLGERIKEFDTYHLFTPKNSPILKPVNDMLVRMLDAGLFLELRRKWFERRINERCGDHLAQRVSITMAIMQGVFYLATGGITFAALVFVLEVVVGQCLSFFYFVC